MSHKGFTLVEMLVSMILLSMVILIGSGAYSQFSERWDGRLGYFNQVSTQAKNLILVQEILDSIVPYVVTDNDNQARIYFEGNRNGFVAVSLRSLFNPEMSAVIKLSVLQQDDFTFTLIYQESVMDQQLLTNAQQEVNFGQEIILFNDLKEINFSYYGWPSIADKTWSIDSITDTQKPMRWSDNYNSLDSSLQPEEMKITFSSEQGDYLLHTVFIDTPKGILNRFGERHDL